MPQAEVLVVDDSMSARFALTRSLQSHDVNIVQAKNAEEALQTVNQSRFDMIFMDHVLPGMNGLEAVEKIRQLPQFADTPIIMCSSNDGQEYIDEAHARGASDVLAKPPQESALAAIMDKYLSAAPATEATAEAAVTEEPAAPVAEEPVRSTELPETTEMSDNAQLQALDQRIERLEQMMSRLEENISKMDARTSAVAKVIADQAGRDLANRLLRAVITLKGK